MEKIISDKERIRLDNFLKEKYPDYSRGYFQRLIKNGFVKINDKHSESGHKIHIGDVVEIDFVDKEQKTLPSQIPLEIIFEDKDLIVINKQPNLVVHPAGYHQKDTLVNGLLYYFDGKYFPFLVHRLDKDTSGVIVVAKNEKSKEFLSRQFQNRNVEKKYLTIVNGIIKEDDGIIETPLGRSREFRKKIVVGSASKKMSKTFFKVIERFKTATYLEVKPYTGRTHQIRVHLAYIGHPVIGDVEYGKVAAGGKPSEIAKRQLLHASNIKLTHPSTKKKIEFSASLPKDFQSALNFFKNEKSNNF
ncbi:MAG: RluA family pseudouridine synthase [Elusimicrobia bacterium]|nr:RluA family pseudouridine synthase [Elusimicrobiota bacterium]